MVPAQKPSQISEIPHQVCQGTYAMAMGMPCSKVQGTVNSNSLSKISEVKKEKHCFYK